MSTWRVGDEIGLFRGDEFYAMTPTQEKAAVLARWLNWASTADGDTAWLAGLSDAQLRVIRNAVVNEELRRGTEAPGGAPEGGAEGDLAAAGPVTGVGADGAVGEGDGGDRSPWWERVGADGNIRERGAVG